MAAAIARALDRVLGDQVQIGILKALVIFCGAGLAVSLLLASYGVDLSAGFF
jgi:hypothetical protein